MSRARTEVERLADALYWDGPLTDNKENEKPYSGEWRKWRSSLTVDTYMEKARAILDADDV